MSSGTSTVTTTPATFPFVVLAFAFIHTTFALGTNRFLFAQQPVYAVAYGGGRSRQYVTIPLIAVTFFG